MGRRDGLTDSAITICLPKFLLGHKNITHDFLFDTWVMPQRCDLAAPGVPSGEFIFEHSHVAYQNNGDEDKNRMQVNFHPRVKIVTLG